MLVARLRSFDHGLAQYQGNVMPTRFDLLIKDVQTTVDSLNKFNVQSDIGIKGSKITAVAQGTK